MVEKLTVIFFVLLCLLLGTYLILSPWTSFPFGQWNDNFFLVFLSEKLGLTFFQSVIGSTWFRGGITGLGILNLLMAFWELAHFGKSVEMLKAENAPTVSAKQ